MTNAVTLQEYVRDTLLAVAGGIREAQEHEEFGALIGRAAKMSGNPNVALDSLSNVVTTVEFDVATTVEESSSGKVGGAVKVVAIGSLGADGAKGHRSEAVSRITFSVTLSMPRPLQQTIEEDQQRERQNTAIRNAATRARGGAV